uniref:Uncharacterized protein n=1 Tax=Gopherus agassizii TaxID=38772 RepID=A0A452J5E9_9SAUR
MPCHGKHGAHSAHRHCTSPGCCFQSLDISCNPRDTVDAHLLHPTSLYLLHTLAHNVRGSMGTMALATALGAMGQVLVLII